MAAGRRQDLPHAPGGPGRGRGRPRRRRSAPRDRTAGPRPAELRRRARGAAAPARRPTAASTLEEMDLPGLLGAPPELAPDRRARAHERARASSTRKRYEDIDDVLDAGHRRLLDRQRPAPRVAQRPGRRADRRARARDVARRGARARRRGRARRPHARGADRAPAGGQGLPAPSACRRRSTASSAIENLAGAARGRAAPGRRGGRRARLDREPARRARGRGCSRGTAPPGESGSGCSRSSTPDAASSASCGARGARRSGWRAELDILVVREPERARRARSASSSTRCAGSASLLGAHLLVEEGDDPAEVVARVARERGTTYVLMGRRRPRARARPPAEPLPDAAACERCPASTSGSSPTARGRRGDALPRGGPRSGSGRRQRAQRRLGGVATSPS